MGGNITPRLGHLCSITLHRAAGTVGFSWLSLTRISESWQPASLPALWKHPCAWAAQDPSEGPCLLCPDPAAPAVPPLSARAPGLLHCQQEGLQVPRPLSRTSPTISHRMPMAAWWHWPKNQMATRNHNVSVSLGIVLLGEKGLHVLPTTGLA